jgi:hypothetical protein
VFFGAKFLQNEKIKPKRKYSFVIFHFKGGKAPNFEKKKKKPDFNQWYKYLISTVCMLSIVSFF